MSFRQAAAGTLKAYLFFAATISTVLCQNNSRIFEAEDAVLNGTVVETEVTGFTGTWDSIPPGGFFPVFVSSRAD